MTIDPEKPDFIVDQNGNVRDVRRVRYAQPYVPKSTREVPYAAPENIDKHPSPSILKKAIAYFVVTVGVLIIAVPLVAFGYSYIQMQIGAQAEARRVAEANTFFDAAEDFYYQGLYDQAIASYSEAIRIKPDYYQAYNNRAIAFFKKGEYDKAIDDCNKAIELQPNYSPAFNNLGAAYYEKGDYEHAISYLNWALHLNPYSGKAYYNRGLVHFKLRDYDLALLDFDQAIKVTPESINAIYQKKPTFEHSLFNEEVTNRMRDLLDEADLPLIYMNRGKVYCIKGDYEKAIADFNKAIQLQPDLASAYYYRGVAYLAQGYFEQAVFNLKKVLELNNDPEARQAAESLLIELGVE